MALEGVGQRGRAAEAGAAGDLRDRRVAAAQRVGRERQPLCTFPIEAHYSGSGDVNNAANWICPSFDASLLRVGVDGQQAGLYEPLFNLQPHPVLNGRLP